MADSPTSGKFVWLTSGKLNANHRFYGVFGLRSASLEWCGSGLVQDPCQFLVRPAQHPARGRRWALSGSRQWPEVSDFVAHFCTLRESENTRTFENCRARLASQKTHGHARIARVSDSRNLQKSVTRIIYLVPLPMYKCKYWKRWCVYWSVLVRVSVCIWAVVGLY